MGYIMRKTTPEIYRAIYNEHKDDLMVFESYTEMDDHGEALKAQITGWGFVTADTPIIRSELRDFTEWSYWIYDHMKDVEPE